MFIKYFLIISSVTFFVLFCFDALSYADGITLVGSKQGQSVGFIDIDGDGIDDEIIGAPYANLHLKSGAILVYMGNTYGRFFPRPFVLLSDDDNYGFSFKNIGDTDGDGREDFAVGAINGGGPDVSLSGSVIVYKGYKGSKKIISKLSGEGAMDKFGFFISAGDLNGDGKRDLIVGAPFNTNDPSIYQGGAVYVYLAPYFTSKIAIYASSINKGLGWSAEAGDINGDNIDDLCISASGKVLCYYGSQNFNPLINSPDVTIKSASSGFGKTIAIFGDFDADKFNEIIISAPNAVVNGNRDTGSIYIVKGGIGNRTINVDSSSFDLVVRIDGESLFSRFGFSIACVGDIDCDQKPDFAVGAPLADTGTLTLAGKVYILYGRDINSSSTLVNSTIFEGYENSQGYGTSLAVKNGRLLIGAPRTNKDTGRTYLVDLYTGQIITE